MSTDDIYRRIFPDSVVVLAYFLHICLYLTANGQTLVENLKIDCIEEEVAESDPQLQEVVAALGETRQSVVWTKRRSTVLQRRNV